MIQRPDALPHTLPRAHAQSPPGDETPTACGPARLERIVALWRAERGDRRGLNESVVVVAGRSIRALLRAGRARPEACSDDDLAGWIVQIEVAQAFLAVPELDQAFSEGLAWEKVVLLASVVSPAHVRGWLAAARCLSPQELELLVARSMPGGPPVVEPREAEPARLESAAVRVTDAGDLGVDGETPAGERPSGSHAAPPCRERVDAAPAWRSRRAAPYVRGNLVRRFDLSRRPDRRVRAGGVRHVDAPDVRRTPPIDFSTA